MLLPGAAGCAVLLNWAALACTGRLCGCFSVQQPLGTAGEGHASWASPAAEQERLCTAAEMLRLFLCAPLAYSVL